MKMNKLKAICLIAMAAGFVTSCGKKSEDNENKDSVRVEQVKVTTLKTQEINRIVDISTTLDGWETVNIAPTIQGHIEKLYVDVDSKVGAGQMLVKMDETQYNNIKLAFANLKVEFARMEALKKTGSVSQQAYDQVKLSYDQTKEQLDYLQKNTFVKSPISGVVTEKNYETGELYAAKPIYVIKQVNVLKAIVGVPEGYLPKIKKGMSVSVSTDIYPGETFPATIDIVYPSIDEATHSFNIKLRINNPGNKLRPGMYAKTSLNLGKDNTIVVPYQSVLKLQGSDERYIFVNDKGYAKRVTVKVGQRFDEMVELISDSLKEGDQIVTTGQGRLVKGVKLNIVK